MIRSFRKPNVSPASLRFSGAEGASAIPASSQSNPDCFSVRIMVCVVLCQHLLAHQDVQADTHADRSELEHAAAVSQRGLYRSPYGVPTPAQQWSGNGSRPETRVWTGLEAVDRWRRQQEQDKGNKQNPDAAAAGLGARNGGINVHGGRAWLQSHSCCLRDSRSRIADCSLSVTSNCNLQSPSSSFDSSATRSGGSRGGSAGGGGTRAA